MTGENIRLGSEMEKISAVMITKNEEKNIRRTLDSINWVDEIVIVDQFSQDRTPEICRARGCRVYQKEMEGFGVQKQFGVDQACHEWILSIDADEVATEELKESIQGVLSANSDEAGFYIYRRNNYLGKWIRHCGWYVPILRLFRKTRGGFDSRRVHESVRVLGKTGVLKGDLLHYTYKDIFNQLEKMNLYSGIDTTEIEKKDIRISPVNAIWYLFLKPLAVFIRKYFLLSGFREGIHGLVLSSFAAFGVFLNYAKLWELQKEKDESGIEDKSD